MASCGKPSRRELGNRIPLRFSLLRHQTELTHFKSSRYVYPILWKPCMRDHQSSVENVDDLVDDGRVV